MVEGERFMTIKEVEEQTGLSRSNLRFYEKEKLIHPARNEKNDYREYSQQDSLSADIGHFGGEHLPDYQ